MPIVDLGESDPELVALVREAEDSEVEGGLVVAGRGRRGKRAEYRCAGCGYGIVVYGQPPSCPMCREPRWEHVEWRPFSQLLDFPLAPAASNGTSLGAVQRGAPIASGQWVAGVFRRWRRGGARQSRRYGPFDPRYRPTHRSARKRPDSAEMVMAEDEGLAVVDAPTAPKGFLLALRLPGYRWNKQSEDGRWLVSVQLVDPESLPALLNVVRQWLRREQIEATQVCVGTQTHRLPARGSAAAARERAVGAKQDTRASR
jgi:hypothetical protein